LFLVRFGGCLCHFCFRPQTSSLDLRFGFSGATHATYILYVARLTRLSLSLVLRNLILVGASEKVNLFVTPVVVSFAASVLLLAGELF